MVMLSRRSFLMLGASIPIAAATAALVATPAAAESAVVIGFDYGANDWTVVSWMYRGLHGRIGVRPLPRYVRGFVHGRECGLEVSHDNQRWRTLVSHRYHGDGCELCVGSALWAPEWSPLEPGSVHRVLEADDLVVEHGAGARGKLVHRAPERRTQRERHHMRFAHHEKAW
jgi:hypothetical protein